MVARAASPRAARLTDGVGLAGSARVWASEPLILIGVGTRRAEPPVAYVVRGAGYALAAAGKTARAGRATQRAG